MPRTLVLHVQMDSSAEGRRTISIEENGTSITKINHSITSRQLFAFFQKRRGSLLGPEGAYFALHELKRLLNEEKDFRIPIADEYGSYAEIGLEY